MCFERLVCWCKLSWNLYSWYTFQSISSEATFKAILLFPLSKCITVAFSIPDQLFSQSMIYPSTLPQSSNSSPQLLPSSQTSTASSAFSLACVPGTSSLKAEESDEEMFWSDVEPVESMYPNRKLFAFFILTHSKILWYSMVDSNLGNCHFIFNFTICICS